MYRLHRINTLMLKKNKVIRQIKCRSYVIYRTSRGTKTILPNAFCSMFAEIICDSNLDIQHYDYNHFFVLSAETYITSIMLSICLKTINDNIKQP